MQFELRAGRRTPTGPRARVRQASPASTVQVQPARGWCCAGPAACAGGASLSHQRRPPYRERSTCSLATCSCSADGDRSRRHVHARGPCIMHACMASQPRARGSQCPTGAPRPKIAGSRARRPCSPIPTQDRSRTRRARTPVDPAFSVYAAGGVHSPAGRPGYVRRLVDAAAVQALKSVLDSAWPEPGNTQCWAALALAARDKTCIFFSRGASRSVKVPVSRRPHRCLC